MTATDPFDTPEWHEFADHIASNVAPAMRGSSVVVSLLPDGMSSTDVKLAVELGMSIAMDKPIILLVRPGTKVPSKLVEIADAIVEGDPMHPSVQASLRSALERLLGDRS